MAFLVRFLIEQFKTYSGEQPVWILYLLSLVYFSFFAGKDGRRIFLYPFLALLVTVFNPVFVYLARSYSAVFADSRYFRFFWLLVYYAVTAAAVTHLIMRVRKAWGRWLLAVVFAAAIVVTGQLTFTAGELYEFRLPENSFYTTNEIVTMSALFHSEGKECPNVLYDTEMAVKFRTFDPSVTSEVSRAVAMHYERGQRMDSAWSGDEKRMLIYDVYFNEDYSVPEEAFREAVEYRHIDYIAVPGESEKEAYMIRCGFRDIGGAARFRIYSTDGSGSGSS